MHAYMHVYIQHGETALFGAAMRGHVETVERLIKLGANIHHEDLVLGSNGFVLCSYGRECENGEDTAKTWG